MPGLQQIGSRGHPGQIEGSLPSGDGKVGMRNNPDPGAHPGVNVAFDPDHHFWVAETTLEGRIFWRLTLVPVAVDLGEWMNVVGQRVGVDHLERLPDLDPEDPRGKPTAPLLDRHRFSGRCEPLPLQSLAKMDEDLSEAPPVWSLARGDNLLPKRDWVKGIAEGIPIHIDDRGLGRARQAPLDQHAPHNAPDSRGIGLKPGDGRGSACRCGGAWRLLSTPAPPQGEEGNPERNRQALQHGGGSAPRVALHHLAPFVLASRFWACAGSPVKEVRKATRSSRSRRVSARGRICGSSCGLEFPPPT